MKRRVVIARASTGKKLVFEHVVLSLREVVAHGRVDCIWGGAGEPSTNSVEANEITGEIEIHVYAKRQT